MRSQTNSPNPVCPVTLPTACKTIQEGVDEVVRFCQDSDLSFAAFERELLARMALLGQSFLSCFLIARYHRVDLKPWLEDGRYRPGDLYATRTLKTPWGKVRYGRQYLQACGNGRGWFPLDALLGLTSDCLSPWIMQWVARLATRMSFQVARSICQAALNWSPAVETIEQVVLGWGRVAGTFLECQAPPEKDGEVLVIEIDGKCPPTATEAELKKRRGKRSQHPKACSCGCQRHRGQAKRKRRGAKKRRKKGDKSKNGKEVSVVVMYTLKRGEDVRLHGPVNKKLYATFAGRSAAAKWARAEATRRGFGPETTQTVQIVLDGAKGLKHQLEPLFPKAIFTLDVCHVVEKLWALGHDFHAEGSEALKAWVEVLKELVYRGKSEVLIGKLEAWLNDTPVHGPGTKGRRKALESLIGYLKPRVGMMQYQEWVEQDLVIASGQVEGAVRHLVGERFDCSGMRWIPKRAERLLHLRCIELNGDWSRFVDWFENRTLIRLRNGEPNRILTDQPGCLNQAA